MSKLFQKRFYAEDELRDAGIGAVGENVRIHEDCNIFGLENIRIGSNVRIDAYVTIIATGPVEIGSFVHIASYTLLSGGDGIRLHDFCGLSHGVRVYSRSDDYSGKGMTNPTVPPQFTRVERGKVELHRHVIIGSGSIVLPGVTIGEGASVGALSLVNKDLPEWELYFGSPARRIGSRSRDLLDLERQLLAQGPAGRQVA
jgi:galactoside O-acetyltransferase